VQTPKWTKKTQLFEVKLAQVTGDLPELPPYRESRVTPPSLSLQTRQIANVSTAALLFYCLCMLAIYYQKKKEQNWEKEGIE